MFLMKSGKCHLRTQDCLTIPQMIDSTELMLLCVGIASREQVLFEDEDMIFLMLSFDILRRELRKLTVLFVFHDGGLKKN